MIAQAYERERLAAKVRLLVGRAYKRGAARQALRDQGVELTAEPGTWDAYDDYIFQTFQPRVDRLAGQGQEGSGPDRSGEGRPASPTITTTAPSHLSVLPGGGEDTRPGAAAGGRSGQLRHGGKPPFRSGESVAALPSNFGTEETE